MPGVKAGICHFGIVVRAELRDSRGCLLTKKEGREFGCREELVRVVAGGCWEAVNDVDLLTLHVKSD